MRETARKVFGSKVADRTGPVWGFNSEAEIQGIWRKSGHPGCAFHASKIVLMNIADVCVFFCTIGSGTWAE